MCGDETPSLNRPVLWAHFDSWAYYVWLIVRISLEVSDPLLGIELHVVFSLKNIGITNIFFSGNER
jgi:hypothetical protein